ncbi:dihydroxy-acid dehydratase [Sediminispirochaeta smaragdinae]|uniref:Dihydroxy-acid dehydratase n=1 Tax=Sediminispirochaeta smaragdinae (strain DSM 11293 / JCM 15392 / SEBR 4228) TaxID=573413 RepID=E1R5W9_SEDSS|nr:dihydroxy-acid dehydratase [Sediminispirochaeta smaragdinae]ADK80734.1 dihydroxy-acid dehydratase [Sediminispirochaeta smaragdinae DSM 11293]
MRSDKMKLGSKRAPHRSLMKALGLTDREIAGPIIGIASSASELIPGHMHLAQVEDAVKAGVRMAGATPLRFSTIGVCDGIAMDHKGMYYSLPSRELIADSIEIVAEGHPFDGMVFISNCDKITPGMLMAMGRLNIPSVLISGGPMLAGNYHGKSLDLISVFEAVGRHAQGNIDDDELAAIESYACPGAGSCSGLFTANSMNSLAEVLGLALPGNGTIPAVDSGRIRLAKEAGMAVVRLVKEDICPRNIATEDSFMNAVAADLALGGSSNTALHLPAIAKAFDVDFSIDNFDLLGRRIPHLCNLSPVGKHHIQDLEAAGGIGAILSRLNELGELKRDARSVTGKTIGEIADASRVWDDEVVRPVGRPYHSEGGLAVLHGSLAPDGAVVKLAGVPEALRVHEGPAVVYEDGEVATEAILAGKVKSGDVVVIRNEGPKGGPGMREMLSPTSAIVGLGLIEKVVLITDGRFSGGSTGAVIGHVSPEAANGGPIGLVQEGDRIRVDFNKRSLDLLVEEDEKKRRAGALAEASAEKPVAAKHNPDGYLARYSIFVGSAAEGAIYRKDFVEAASESVKRLQSGETS